MARFLLNLILCLYALSGAVALSLLVLLLARSKLAEQSLGGRGRATAATRHREGADAGLAHQLERGLEDEARRHALEPRRQPRDLIVVKDEGREEDIGNGEGVPERRRSDVAIGE
mgnify:CR=1 FL=1